MVRLLMSLAVIVITATETRAQQGVDYLLRQAIPTSPTTAPDQLQLPTAWVQALNEGYARTEKVGQEIGGCLTFSVLPTADTARREAAIRVLGSKAEETGAAVDGLQRLALAAHEATGPHARGIVLGDEVSIGVSCARGEAFFHTHPPPVPDEWSFLPSGTDAKNTLLNVTEESVLHQKIRLVRARTGISLVLPTQLSTDTTGIAALFEAPRFAFRWEKQETLLRQIRTGKELAQMITALQFGCDLEAPDRGAACSINQLTALLTTAGFAFYTGGTDGALRRVHPTRPAPLKIMRTDNQLRIMGANLLRYLATGRAPASLQEFLQPPLWGEMVTPSMRATHTHFASMFARAGFSFSDEILVQAQHIADVHFNDLQVFPSVSTLDMLNAELDGKGKHLPISFVPCNRINLDGDTWTTFAITERWLPAGAKHSDQLVPHEGGQTAAVLISKRQNRVLATTYGRVQGGQVLFEGEWPSQYGVTWKGRFTINSKDACSFQPVGAGSGKYVDKKTGATVILDGSMADRHFTGTYTFSNGTIQRIENLMIY